MRVTLEKSNHSEVHPPTCVSYLYNQNTKMEVNVQQGKRALLLFTDPSSIPSLLPQSLLDPPLHERRTTSCLQVINRLEKSFGFLHIHLLPAGQSPVLHPVHVQGFLSEQPHTISKKQSQHCSLYRRSKVIFPEHTHASVRFQTQPSFFILHLQYNLHGHISRIQCPQQLKGCE